MPRARDGTANPGTPHPLLDMGCWAEGGILCYFIMFGGSEK